MTVTMTDLEAESWVTEMTFTVEAVNNRSGEVTVVDFGILGYSPNNILVAWRPKGSTLPKRIPGFHFATWPKLDYRGLPFDGIDPRGPLQAVVVLATKERFYSESRRLTHHANHPRRASKPTRHPFDVLDRDRYRPPDQLKWYQRLRPRRLPMRLTTRSRD